MTQPCNQINPSTSASMNTAPPSPPQIKIRECASCKKMLPTSKGRESFPLPGLRHQRLKSCTVQVLAAVLPPSRRAHGPNPPRHPSSLLEALSPGPLSLPLQGWFNGEDEKREHDNYGERMTIAMIDFPEQRGSLVSVPQLPNQKVVT